MRHVLIAVVLALIVTPCATTLAGQPLGEGVCQHPRTDQCRALRAMNAFIGYAEHRWVVRGEDAFCHGEHPRWSCTLPDERPNGTFTSCKVEGTVVEKKLGVSKCATPKQPGAARGAGRNHWADGVAPRARWPVIVRRVIGASGGACGDVPPSPPYNPMFTAAGGL